MKDITITLLITSLTTYLLILINVPQFIVGFLCLWTLRFVIDLIEDNKLETNGKH